MRKNSLKNTRINSEVMRELSVEIRGLKDPRISPMTSVTGVVVTPDLQYCKVFVSVLGDDSEKQETLKGLRQASGYLRKNLAGTVNLRHTPELQFVIDNSIEYGQKMDELIKQVLEKDQGNNE